MRNSNPLGRAAALCLAILLAFATLPAQQRRRRTPARRRAPAPTSTRAPRPSADANKTNTTPRPKATPQQTPATSTQPADASAAARASDGQDEPDKDEPDANEVEFDTLLAEGAYAFYMEERAVGQQLRQGGIFELLRPLWEMAGAPDESRRMLEFFHAHSEALASSRLFVAAMPSEPSLPSLVTAVELPSVEAAEKFAPEYRKYMAELMLATKESGDGPGRGATLKAKPQTAALRTEQPKPPPQLYVQRFGSIVVSSDKQLKPHSLRPKESKALSANPQFKAARSRFASEPLFAYFDVAVMTRVFMRGAEEAEAEARRRETELASLTPADTAVPAETVPLVPPDADALTGEPGEEMSAAEELPADVQELMSREAANVDPAAGVGEESATTPEGAEEVAPEPDLMSVLAPLVIGRTGGNFMNNLPKAIGAAVAPEGDTLAVRLLLFNEEHTKGSILPIFPTVLAGPPLTPEASSVARSDTAVLVSLSLDVSRMYERALETAAEMEKQAAAEIGEPPPPAPGTSPAGKLPPPSPATKTGRGDVLAEEEYASPLGRIRAIEKLFGFRVKEDLIDSLGNELSVSLPAVWFKGATPPAAPPDAQTQAAGQTSNASQPTTQSATTSTPSATPTPTPVQRNIVVLVSLRDKAKLQSILPRVAAALGMRRPQEPVQALKRGDTEMMSFGGASYAFVGNYLAGSTDAESLMSVIDAYAEGQTLGSATDFRAATRWQPRQLVGQLYVANGLLKHLFGDTRQALEREADPETRALLPHLTSEPGAVTLAAVNEPEGPLHELRLPVGLLSMFAAAGAAEKKLAPVRLGESRAEVALRTIHDMQMASKQDKKRNRFASLEELKAGGLIYDGLLENDGYKFDLTVSGDKFELTATPTDYPHKGRRSFFIDETGVMRGGDKGGRPASASDEPITN